MANFEITLLAAEMCFVIMSLWILTTWKEGR